MFPVILQFIFFPLLCFQEVEREISFRTECGLYYSYFKQLLQAPSIQEGRLCFFSPPSNCFFFVYKCTHNAIAYNILDDAEKHKQLWFTVDLMVSSNTTFRVVTRSWIDIMPVCMSKESFQELLIEVETVEVHHYTSGGLLY